MHHYWIILLSAFFLEIAFGYPNWLYKRIGHPVSWMGAAIAVLEQKFNRSGRSADTRRLLGIAAMGIILIPNIIIITLVKWSGSGFLEILITASLLATRSLYDHVYVVSEALTNDDITQAREKVSRIVGRDVSALDEAGICRAAIESLAESFSDGVITPLFWAVCLGLPGIICCKAINTADSMIGHKDERYRAFGWAAARLDDVANYIPARLSGLLIVAASLAPDALRCMLAYAHKHASPNAGWPEAAMAGALQVQLGGVNSYDDVPHEAPLMGDGTREITLTHVQKALSFYITACAIVWFMLLLALLTT